MVVLAATACTSAPSPHTQPVLSSRQSCDQIVATDKAAFTGVFRSDFLYTCRLGQAFRDYVDARQGCTSNDECTFVSGYCVIPGEWINAKYLQEVTAVRDHLASAARDLVSCTSCGGTGSPPAPQCLRIRSVSPVTDKEVGMA